MALAAMPTTAEIWRESLSDMAKKFKLYAEETDWDEKEVELMAYLGLPSPAAASYASKETVPNPASDDYGKFIMPVMTSGPYKCDDQFSSGVIDWQADWLLI